MPLPAFPGEWRGWSSAPAGSEASRDNGSPVPEAGGHAGLAHQRPTSSHCAPTKGSAQRTPQDAQAGAIKGILIFFSADRSCLEALNGFQNSGEKYGSQFTGLINNICLPARQREGGFARAGVVQALETLFPDLSITFSNVTSYVQ